MSLLWIMVGLTVIVSGLLILNILFFRKNRAEVKRRDAEILTDKEIIFQINCEKFQLSAREVEVLRLILIGHTYREAAEMLFIAEKTVDTHMRNIYAKVSVKNKMGLYNRLYKNDDT